MATKFGKVLCSASTEMATDIFAQRIDQRARAVSERYNRSVNPNAGSQNRHLLVVRGYSLDDEVTAVQHLLQNSQADDSTIAGTASPRGLRWRKHLSLASWLLAILGSPAVRPLHPDDKEILWKYRGSIPSNPVARPLYLVATGQVSWEKSAARQLRPAQIRELLQSLLDNADVLCTTPAATESGDFKPWKTTLARAVVVDDAGRMKRADLYCVWGNTLTPCFLVGNSEQLSLPVLAPNEADSHGSRLNRFAEFSRISALEAFMASGVPVYRLTNRPFVG